MNQLTSSLPGLALTTDPTLQPGLGRLVTGAATPSSGHQASLPTMSIRENGGGVQVPRPFATLQDDADRNSTSATASKPSFCQAPPEPSPIGQVANSGDQSKAGSVRRFADPMSKAAITANMIKTGLLDPNERDVSGLTRLQAACRQGENAVVEELIEYSKRSCDDIIAVAARSKLTPTPLCIAAEEGNLALINYLLEEGDDPNFWDASSKRTALMAAMFNDKRDAMICLLENGATFGMPMSYERESSLPKWAIERRDCDMVRLLLKRCAAGSGQGNFRYGAALTGAVQMKCGIVERVLEARSAAATPDEWVKLVQELIKESHASLIGLKSRTQAHPASALGAGQSGEVVNGGNPMAFQLKNCIPVIAIADLPLLHMPQEKLWSYNKTVDSSPLQIFNQLVSTILSRGHANGMVCESLLKQLHDQHVLTAVALSVTDCLVNQNQWLGLHVGSDAFANEQQKAICYAAALSTLAPLVPSREMLRDVYMAAGISTSGADRLAMVAQSQFDQLQDLVFAVSTKLSDDMLSEIMPACLKHTNGGDEVNVGKLAKSLVASGLIRPIAVAVAESWQTAVNALMNQPLEIPPGATIIEVVRIIGDNMNTVVKQHFAATLQAELRKWNVDTPFRVMSVAAKTDDALDPLFQLQINLLKDYCTKVLES